MTKTATSLKRAFAGCAVSNKMDRIVTVLIESRVKHPLYGKYVVCSKKYHAHDEVSQYNEGGKVGIMESRPFPRAKSWVVSCLFETTRVI